MLITRMHSGRSSVLLKTPEPTSDIEKTADDFAEFLSSFKQRLTTFADQLPMRRLQ